MMAKKEFLSFFMDLFNSYQFSVISFPFNKAPWFLEEVEFGEGGKLCLVLHKDTGREEAVATVDVAVAGGEAQAALHTLEGLVPVVEIFARGGDVDEEVVDVAGHVRMVCVPNGVVSDGTLQFVEQGVHRIIEPVKVVGAQHFLVGVEGPCAVGPGDLLWFHGLAGMLFQIAELHDDLIKHGFVGGREEQCGEGMAGGRLEIHCGAHRDVATHDARFGMHRVVIGFHDAETVAVMPGGVVGVETFGGEIESLVGCEKDSFLFVVDGEGIKEDASSGGLKGLTRGSAQFVEEGDEFTRVVVGVEHRGVVVGVDGVVVVAAERPGDFDVVSVGLVIDEAINDGGVLIVSIEIDIRAARGQHQQCQENQVKFQSKEVFNLEILPPQTASECHRNGWSGPRKVFLRPRFGIVGRTNYRNNSDRREKTQHTTLSFFPANASTQ